MLKSIFTSFLVFWLTGASFLLCCFDTQTNQETISCPLAKIKHCKNSKNQELAESLQNTSFDFDCCAPFTKLFDKTKKNEDKDRKLSIKPILEKVIYLPSDLQFKKLNSNAENLFPRTLKVKLHIKNRILRI